MALVVAAGWAPAVSAAAGIAGVVVALSADAVRRRWRRPVIALLPFQRESADGVGFRRPTDGKQSAWLRLRVLNEGREIARGVEVTIEAIAEIKTGQRADPHRHDVRQAFQRQVPDSLLGRRLKWADREEAAIDIPARSLRRVDIVHVTDEEPTLATHDGVEVPIRITLQRAPESERHLLPGLTYRVVVSFGGLNFDPYAYEFVVKFGGGWLEGDQMWNSEAGGLTVQEMRPTRLVKAEGAHVWHASASAG